VFVGNARQRHDLIDCSESRMVSAQPVLNTYSNAAVHSGVRQIEFRLVQFSSYAVNKPLIVTRNRFRQLFVPRDAMLARYMLWL